MDRLKKILDSKMTHYLGYIVISIFLVVLTMETFYKDDFLVQGHDTAFLLSRLKSLDITVRDSAHPFYIDYTYVNEYGYAMNLFYPSATLYPFAYLVEPFGVIVANKISIYFSLLLGLFIAFISIKKVHGRTSIAVLFSWLYVFSLYRFVTMGMRGAWGEMFALSFIPLVYWGAYEIICGNYKRRWYIIGVAFTCLLLTHILSTLIVFVGLCIFFLLFAKRIIAEPKRLAYLLYAGVLAMLLSSFFLFPMLEQMMSNSFYYKTHPYIADMTEKLSYLRWVVWGMFSGFTDSPSRIPSIGLMLTLPILIRVFLQRNDVAVRIADLFAICGFVFLLGTTDVFPWQYLPYSIINIIQFPWRLMMLVVFCLSLAGSIYAVKMLNSRKTAYAFFTVVILLFFMQIKNNGGMFFGADGNEKYDTKEYYSTPSYCDRYTFGGGEYLPSKFPSVDYGDERGRFTVTGASASSNVSNVERKNYRLTFDVANASSEVNNLVLPLTYYKGYRAVQNGENLPIKESSDGLIEIETSKIGNVQVWYAGTFIQKITVYVSLLTLIGLIVYLFYPKLFRKNRDRLSDQI